MASSSLTVKLRKVSQIFLIGSYSSQIIGNKLPSKGQVLKVMFFNLRQVKLEIMESARLAVREALLFWEKARIPTQAEKNCIPKLKKLYEEWRGLQKSSSKDRDIQKEKEQKFLDQLDELFDIAHENAMSLIRIEEDREFLKQQRQKGRPGYMCGIDQDLLKREQKSYERAERMENHKKRKLQEMTDLSERVDLECSTSGSELGDDEDVGRSLISTGLEQNLEKDGEDVGCSSISTGLEQNLEKEEDAAEKLCWKRGQRKVINERVVYALDKCKISDREAVHIISAIADSLGHDLNSLVINTSSIRRCREKIRQEKAQKIKEEFGGIDLNAAVIHWDGKLLPALTGKETVDRLPIIITNGEIEQILQVPALENGSGEAQANAIFQVVCEWGLQDVIKACCFDTTATNTGQYAGTCVLLEQRLGRSLLYLACRHHILEIVLRAVFENKIPGTSGPNVPIFKRFQSAWPKIDQTKFLPGIVEPEIKKIFVKDVISIINYLKSITTFSRNDYREFAELCIIFLGGQLPGEVTFHYPGAMHHARWMAKAIYFLKIYLFRTEFKMSAAIQKSLSHRCSFIVKVYVKKWFTSSLPEKAPQSDLQLIRSLYEYRKIDETISTVGLRKFLNHLWYLTPEAVLLSLFDDEVSVEVKERMREKLRQPDSENDEEQIFQKKNRLEYSAINDVVKKGVDQFVRPESKNFFVRFGIDPAFLEKEVEEWSNDEEYNRAKKIATKIKVTNDTAERGVKLMEEYNGKLSMKEEQKQYTLQVVSNYRKLYPDFKKETLVKRL